VAVFGCGPVGLFAIAGAQLMRAGRVLAIDAVPARLEMARALGAEVIDFDAEDPVEAIRELTGGIGTDRVIDAVGVDAVQPHRGPAAEGAREQAAQFRREVEAIAPDADPKGDLWVPGDAPSQALQWAVQAVAKAGTLAIIGVYPQSDRFFPIGIAMNRNLTLRMGNCNHRKYLPELVDMVRRGSLEPGRILSQREPVTAAIEAYEAFDRRQPGWIKVELLPEAA